MELQVGHLTCQTPAGRRWAAGPHSCFSSAAQAAGRTRSLSLAPRPCGSSRQQQAVALRPRGPRGPGGGCCEGVAGWLRVPPVPPRPSQQLTWGSRAVVGSGRGAPCGRKGRLSLLEGRGHLEARRRSFSGHARAGPGTPPPIQLLTGPCCVITLRASWWSPPPRLVQAESRVIRLTRRPSGKDGHSHPPTGPRQLCPHPGHRAWVPVGVSCLGPSVGLAVLPTESRSSFFRTGAGLSLPLRAHRLPHSGEPGRPFQPQSPARPPGAAWALTLQTSPTPGPGPVSQAALSCASQSRPRPRPRGPCSPAVLRGRPAVRCCPKWRLALRRHRVLVREASASPGPCTAAPPAAVRSHGTRLPRVAAPSPRSPRAARS